MTTTTRVATCTATMTLDSGRVITCHHLGTHHQHWGDDRANGDWQLRFWRHDEGFTPDRVILSRTKLYPTPGRISRYAWKWTYYYQTEAAGVLADPMPLEDSIVEGRDRLRRLFGRKVVIVEPWKQQA